MRYLIFLALILLSANINAQSNTTEEVQPILDEGKLLYKSEMASWYGTDLFLEKYAERENIGGYFSYTEADSSKCVFYSSADIPEVIGTVIFDSTYDLNKARIELNVRNFTAYESNLFEIRNTALSLLINNSDEFFLFYQNTNPNVIPLIQGQNKKVYILTAPLESGIVIFGNDYLLTFNDENKLITKKKLHNNIIVSNYNDLEDGNQAVGAMHSHLPETGHFITATDVCTLMLYAKFTSWETYNIVSKEYLNIWNCKTNQLTVLPTKTVEKIEKDQKKRKSKK